MKAILLLGWILILVGVAQLLASLNDIYPEYKEDQRVFGLGLLLMGIGVLVWAVLM